MVRGTLDIQKLSNPGGDIRLYQVHLEELAGGRYDASIPENELDDLLSNKLRLDMEIEDLHANLDQLKRTGRITLPNIEMEEADLTASGLVYLPYAG